ncbi:TetR family transcriptional regulator [Spirillospora sp. CA-255316]
MALPAEEKQTRRDVQRRETRRQVFEAAIAEFKRSGMAGADIGAIVKAAGVARGTFYFHFPTKEHVLAELAQQEEDRTAGELGRFLSTAHDIRSALAEVIRLVVAVEQRVGKVVFRELLGLHFSPSRPPIRPDAHAWADFPLLALMVKEIERARDQGEVQPETDPVLATQFFILGLYAVLITSHECEASARAGILDNFVTTTLRGLEPR